MTREEIDAIYDAKQNISPVNNTGITRAEIDAIFDGVANANNAQNMKSIQPTNASVSSPVTEGQDIVDMNGNVTKAKVNTTNSKQKPSFISKEEQQRRIADAQSIKDKKKQADFAKNNFQKTNEVLSGTGIPKGMTKNDVEIQKLYNEMNSTKNPNIKRNLQRTIDEKERVANQTLVSDDADEKEISSALAKWASSGYKMTSEEKKNARKLFGNGFKEGIDMNILSDEDKNNLAVAYSKSNPIQNFMAGFADNPAFKTFSNIYTKYADVTEEERASLEASDELTRRMIENAYTQQPIVTSGGKLAGSMAEYAIGSKVIGALPGVGTATNKAGQAIGKGAEKALGTLGLGMADAGSKGVANIGTKLLSGGAQRAGQAIGNSASNIIGDSLVDVALDTVPNALNDAKSGANGKEVGINAAKNLAANIGFNAVGEAAQVIPYLGMNMKNYGRNDKAYSEAMDNIAKRNPLKPLENMDNTMKQNPINTVADYDVKDEGRVLFENKEKVNTILNRNGLQLPNRISGDDSFFNKSISNSAENVNTPITDYKKVKINNHDDFNSQIDKYVGMYGDDAAKQKAVEVKEAMNKVLADNSDEAWEDAIKKTQQLDNMLQGKSYTYKRKNGKNRNYQQKSTYSGEISSAFNTDAESIASEALENASKNTEKVKYMAEDTGLRKSRTGYGKEFDYDSLVANVSNDTPVKKSVVSQNVYDENGNIVPNQKISKFRTNTMQNSGISTEQELDNIYGKDFYKYTPVSEKSSLEEATRRLSEDESGWYDKFSKADDVNSYNTAQDADTMMQLYAKYNKQAREAKEAGDEVLAKEFYDKARTITSRMRERSTNAGQFIESLKKYSHTADGAVFHAEAIAKKNIENFKAKNPKLATKIDDLADDLVKKASEMEEDPLWKELSEGMLDEDTAQSVTDAHREQIEKMIEDEIARRNNIAKKVNKSDVKKIANDIIEKKNVNDIAETLDSIAAGGFGTHVSDETIDEVTRIFDEAEKYDFNSKKRVELESKAYSLLADEVCQKASFMDKWNSWRYLAMLGNIKTNIKNILGNVAMSATSGIKNNVAAMLEGALAKVSGGKIYRHSFSKAKGGKIYHKKTALDVDRTKAVLNVFSEKDKNLINACKSDAENGFYRQLKGNKYLGSVGNSIDSERKIFDLKPLEALRKFNNSALDNEDYFFKVQKYKTSLAGYLKANGADESIFDAEKNLNLLKQKKDLTLLSANEEKQLSELQSKVDLLDKGREYAKGQAEEATFQQVSQTAQWLSNFSTNLQNSDKISHKALGMLVEGTVPFKKTPINIVKTGASYSPLQIIKSIFYDSFKVNKGTMSVSQYIDNLTKGLTGTGILGVGALMADLGLITASQDSDTKNFDNMQGKQAYALNIGDKTYTLDWATPAVLPLFVGAEVYNVLQSEGYSLDDFMNALSSISQPMMETSMLDGLNNTLESIRYSDDDDNLLATIAGNTATSYLKQGVPTVLGQAARTLDNTRRSTYTEKEGVAGSIDRQIKQIKNKIPVLSESNQPYVDAWGREQSNLNTDNLGQRLFYQTMSPGYLQDVNTTPVDSEIQRLYDSTKDASVMPDSTENKVGGVRLTEQEYTDFAKKKGQTQYDLVGACLENDYYNSLDDEGKAKVISDMYSLSKKVASAYVKDDYTSTDKVFNIYQEGGAQAVLDYMKYRDSVKSAGIESSSERTQAIYDNLGDEGLKLYSEAKAQYGDDEKMYAGNLIPFLDSKSLTSSQKGEYMANFTTLAKGAQQFADKGDYAKVYQYYNIKSNADTDGNGSLKKQELIDYLDGTGMSTAEKRTWFSILSTAKNPY